MHTGDLKDRGISVSDVLSVDYAVLMDASDAQIKNPNNSNNIYPKLFSTFEVGLGVVIMMHLSSKTSVRS